MGLFDRRKPKISTLSEDSTPKKKTIKFDLREYTILETIEYKDINGEEQVIQHLIDEDGLHYLLQDNRMSIGYGNLEYLGHENRFKGKDLKTEDLYYVIGTHQQSGSYKRIDPWRRGALYTTMVSSHGVCIKPGVLGPTLKESTSAEYADIYIAEPRNSKYQRHIGTFTDTDCYCQEVIFTDKDGVHHGMPNGVVITGDDYTVQQAAAVYSGLCVEFDKDYTGLLAKGRCTSQPLTLQETYEGMRECLSSISNNVFANDVFIDHMLDLISQEFNKRLDLVGNVRLEDVQKYIDIFKRIFETKRQEYIAEEKARLEEEEYKRERAAMVETGFETEKHVVKGMKIPRSHAEELIDEVARRHEKGDE